MIWHTHYDWPNYDAGQVFFSPLSVPIKALTFRGTVEIMKIYDIMLSNGFTTSI